MPESGPGSSEYSRSPRLERVHELVREFRDHLTRQKYEVPAHTGGVVVLSAPYEKIGEEINEKSPENVARVEYGISVMKDVAAKRLGKDVADLTNEDIIRAGPPLVLNGETEQLPMMAEVAAELGCPQENIVLVNSGDCGISNTKTQFSSIEHSPDVAQAEHLTFVTSSYHVPRVARTADKNLRPGASFDVIGVPLDKFSYDVYRKVRGEVKRIAAYSEKGDISVSPREKR